MKVAAVFVALAAAVMAAPEKRDFNPASASASLIAVLPSSILNVAITNPGAASTLIEQAFATGTPDWFTKLPAPVQSYFIAQAGGGKSASSSVASSASSVAASVASANGTAMASGSGSMSMTGSGSSATGASASGSSSGSGSSSSSAAGAVPTALIGGGLAGAAGLLGLLIL